MWWRWHDRDALIGALHFDALPGFESCLAQP
jgi:hypothetical protein